MLARTIARSSSALIVRLAAVGLERARDPLEHRLGEIRAERGERPEARIAHGAKELELVVLELREGGSPRGEAPRQERGRVDVGALGDRLAARLLRRHAAERPLHEPHARRGRDAEHLGHAEVGELHPAGPVDEHVRRRDVAMDDRGRLPVLVVLGVGIGEGRQHPLDDVPRRAIGEAYAMARAEAEEAHERDPFDVLEDERRELLLLHEGPHLHDRRMIQPDAQRRFAREHRHELFVARLVRAGEHLDGHELPGATPRQEHLAGATGTEALQDLEPAQRRRRLALGEHGVHGPGPAYLRRR